QHTTPALKQALGIDQEPFPPSATARAMRTSPVIFGRGLLDLVPDSVLLAYADPGDRNHDGVKGRPNRFLDGRIGRFGRKAFVPTLREFNAGASAAEMSITNPEPPTADSTGGEPIPAGDRAARGRGLRRARPLQGAVGRRPCGPRRFP